MKSCLILIAFLVMLQSCDDASSDLKEGADISSLAGNVYVMKVDRATDSPDVQYPKSELRDSDYVQFTGDKAYEITFSGDGEEATIAPGSMSGQKTAAANKLVYDLTSGVFAGGRFVVWKDDGKLQAELTIYGSGVPIVLSERGNMARQ